MAKSKGSKPKASDDFKRVAVRFRDDVELRSEFANQLSVSHDDNCFYISFFQARPPVLAGTPEEIKELVESIDSIDAVCVAKLAVPVGNMKELMAVLAQNWARFAERESQSGAS